jgi:hypothetical protein
MTAEIIKLAKTNKPRRSSNGSAEASPFRRRICYVLSLLKIHSPECEYCNTQETQGEEMRKRLEELSWRIQPRSVDQAAESRVGRKSKRRSR